MKQRRWTEAAKECYRRGCVCSGCSIFPLVESAKCRMKKSVIELVRDFGPPPTIMDFFGNEITRGDVHVLAKIKENNFDFNQSEKKNLRKLKEIAILNGYVDNKNIEEFKEFLIRQRIYEDDMRTKKELNEKLGIELYEKQNCIIESIVKTNGSKEKIKEMLNISESNFQFLVGKIWSILLQENLVSEIGNKSHFEKICDCVLLKYSNNTANTVTIDDNDLTKDKLAQFLTDREWEVLRSLVRTVKYEESAKELIISETTLKTHVNAIFSKLQVNSFAELIKYYFTKIFPVQSAAELVYWQSKCEKKESDKENISCSDFATEEKMPEIAIKEFNDFGDQVWRRIFELQALTIKSVVSALVGEKL